MVKTKTDVERILDKIEGEYKTAFITEDNLSNTKDNDIDDHDSYYYYMGKRAMLEDLKTWINENIINEKE